MNPYRTSPAPEPVIIPWQRVVAASVIAAGVAAAVGGCTAAARQDVAAAAGVLSAVAGSPLPCLVTKVSTAGSGGASATLCGNVSSDLSDVAKLVEDVLLSLPAPAGMKKGEEPAPVQVQVRGRMGSVVTVTLSPMAAEALQKKLATMAAGAVDAGGGS